MTNEELTAKNEALQVQLDEYSKESNRALITNELINNGAHSEFLGVLTDALVNNITIDDGKPKLLTDGIPYDLKIGVKSYMDTHSRFKSLSSASLGKDNYNPLTNNKSFKEMNITEKTKLYKQSPSLYAKAKAQ